MEKGCEIKENEEPLNNNEIEVQRVEKRKAKDLYFELLQTWVSQANISHNITLCFPYYLAANYPQIFQQQPQQISTQQPQQIQVQQQPNQNRFNRNLFRNEEFMDNPLRHEEIINQNGGYEFVIAALWKRFVAEVIDAAILFLIKLMVTFTVLDLFDLNLGIDFNFDLFKSTVEDDSYTEILSITSDLLVLEIITKILVCIYEGIWTGKAYVVNQIGGATPGKIIMRIRIIHVDAVIALDPVIPINLNHNHSIRALVFPAKNPGFKRAFARAFAKNIIMALLFPVCFFMLFFKNNRTGYDILTKTLVVEENHNPTIRRR